jgi:superfamily II DNA or RNA helicase
MKLNLLMKEINAANPKLNIEQYSLQNDLEAQSKAYFSAIGIENPLPLQVLCYNFSTSSRLSGRFLIQLDTGSGKTALCFTIGCYYASN